MHLYFIKLASFTICARVTRSRLDKIVSTCIVERLTQDPGDEGNASRPTPLLVKAESLNISRRTRSLYRKIWANQLYKNITFQTFVFISVAWVDLTCRPLQLALTRGVEHTIRALLVKVLRCVMPFELAGVLHGSELTRCSCQFWHNSRVISSGTLVGQEKYTCGLTAGSLWIIRIR